jgi:pyrroline-5-carboxylate reductase
MQVGFIGSGNMARALARGWGDPVLCTDSGSGRAHALAHELGGEAVAGNRELAERADVVILAHKPAQLAEVAWDAAGAAKAVVSLLARTPIADVRGAYPGVPVFRVEPNTAVEVRRGVLAFAASDAVETDPALRDRLKELFGRVGAVVEVPERLMSVAGACSGVGPAYWSLLAEAWIDAAVRRGMPAPLATQLITETMAGSAELIRSREGDTLAVRREVASPGGTTARGLAALERGGVRAALNSAMDDVVGG